MELHRQDPQKVLLHICATDPGNLRASVVFGTQLRSGLE
jgi:tRNA threonylcarbamoyladenosine modification (KEOPS) complex  Pcc1 subunit